MPIIHNTPQILTYTNYIACTGVILFGLSNIIDSILFIHAIFILSIAIALNTITLFIFNTINSEPIFKKTTPKSEYTNHEISELKKTIVYFENTKATHTLLNTATTLYLLISCNEQTGSINTEKLISTITNLNTIEILAITTATIFSPIYFNLKITDKLRTNLKKTSDFLKKETGLTVSPAILMSHITFQEENNTHIIPAGKKTIYWNKLNVTTHTKPRYLEELWD